MDITEEMVIGEMVANDYRRASVFKKYGIDFCCNGNRTIKNACEKKNISSDTLLNDLNSVLHGKEKGDADYKSWPPDLLADYIEKKHHRYVQAATEEIKPYLTKVCRVHGDHHPELLEINAHFNATAGELAMHMKKEELILFPYVHKLVKAKLDGVPPESPLFGSVKNPIAMMMQEHETEGDRFGKIAELSSGYVPPADACNTYRVTFALLKEFEEDLHLHIHLENNILFPKAIELEKEFM